MPCLRTRAPGKNSNLPQTGNRKFHALVLDQAAYIVGCHQPHGEYFHEAGVTQQGGRPIMDFRSKFPNQPPAAARGNQIPAPSRSTFMNGSRRAGYLQSRSIRRRDHGVAPGGHHRFVVAEIS